MSASRSADAAGTPSSQTEVDLRLPLSDHQNSTRLTLGHDANDAVFLRQTVDYAPFGAVTAIRDSAGALTTAALDTAFAHHGSVQDGATGLALKGARWYSPDLGRFASVDPAEDGANWYAFAGNDPVNFADPTGLSQAGHPLAGGRAAGPPTASAVPTGNQNGGSWLGRLVSSASTAVVDSVRAAGSFVSTVSQGVGHLQTWATGVNAHAVSYNSFTAGLNWVDGQIATAQRSLASRSWYEFIDSNRDRGRIAQLNAQRSQFLSDFSVVKGNTANVLFGLGRTTLWGTDDSYSFAGTMQSLGGYLPGVGQVFAGYGNAGVEAAQGAYQTVFHPIQTLQNVAHAAWNYDESFNAIANQYSEQSQTLQGQGQILGEIFASVLGGAAFKVAGQTQVVQKAAQAANNAAKAAVQAAGGFVDDLARSVEFNRPALATAGPAGQGLGKTAEYALIEPYNRAKHYPNTPTKADRKAVGAGKGQVADHDPPLVKRYYDGDPAVGEKPGSEMTDAERRASSGDRSRMRVQSQTDSNAQGGKLSQWSKQMKKLLGLE